jgi:myo-inositol-1(or 4)-monophosphatase
MKKWRRQFWGGVASLVDLKADPLLAGRVIASADIEFTRRIAAGRQTVQAQTALFHAQFGRAPSHWKYDGTRVTDADVAISEATFTALRAPFPTDDYFSEELAVGSSPLPCRSEWTWVLDPIDGTNNFALGVPLTAISLGLLRNGEPVYGYVYDLGRRTLFHGGPGQGMWADDTALTVQFESTGRHERIVALHAPLDPQHLPLVNAVLMRFKLRAFGSGALHLTYAALGMIDACMDFTVRVWDIAAAAAFCRVTGAPMHFLNGSPFPLREFDLKKRPLHYAAGSPAAMAELVPLVEKVRAAR